MCETNPKYNTHKDMMLDLNKLYIQKNKAYGDSFALGRQQVPYYSYGKLFDKWNRYSNIILGKEVDVGDETIEDTLLDMANYCIMEVLERRLEAKEIK